MAKVTGFMEFKRESYPERPIDARLKDYKEIYEEFPADRLNRQAARCMDCGIPFCHQGCPLGNLIPDWNDLVYKGQWKEAINQLHATNNFPEFTGLLCPAPCEGSCVLGINESPVTIKYIEFNIIDKALKEGWVKPEVPQSLTGKKVAVVGSGPAGMACAQQLRRAGHEVTLFERDDRIGGLLRYGIPDFKMQKHRIDFRVEQMKQEGVIFKTGVRIGTDLKVEELQKNFDAIALCMGATQPRNLQVEGRELAGVHLAMEYLTQQNKLNAGDKLGNTISAKGKNVIILGGGDTGADCLGTATRQGAKSVLQLELLPKPPEDRGTHNPWPTWPVIYRTPSAHNEAQELFGKDIRDFAIMTKHLSGEDGQVKKLHAVKLEWTANEKGQPTKFTEVAGSEFTLDADLVFLAMGFTGPEQNELTKNLGLKLDGRGNIIADKNYKTSVDKTFVAGDAKRGASLIVWAIAEGRKCAKAIDEFLMGESELP